METHTQQGYELIGWQKCCEVPEDQELNPLLPLGAQKNYCFERSQTPLGHSMAHAPGWTFLPFALDWKKHRCQRPEMFLLCWKFWFRGTCRTILELGELRHHLKKEKGLLQRLHPLVCLSASPSTASSRADLGWLSSQTSVSGQLQTPTFA